MKKLFLRHLAFLACLFYSLSCFAEIIDGLSYSFRGSYATVVSNSPKYSGDIVIPSQIEYSGHKYTVTTIGSGAFKDCIDLTSVEIPNSVTSISDNAFYGCTGLTSLEIPNSVTKISDYAFSCCRSIKEVKINDGQTNLVCDKDVFFEVPIEILYLGRSFSCTATEQLSELGQPFRDKESITDLTIGDSVTYITENAFYGCSGLTSVRFGKAVTSISDYAFHGCTGLTSLEIPNNVNKIGKGVFSGCGGIKEINFTDGISPIEIGNDAFRNVPIETLHLGRSVTSNIYSDAFTGKPTLKNLTLGNTVTLIGKYAFNGCSGLTSLEIPNSVTSINDGAFQGCINIKEVNIVDGESILKIGGSVFDRVPIETLHLGRTFTSGGDRPFSDKPSIKTLTIGDSVTSIESNAFYGCSGLTSVVIPNSVTSIEYDAFHDCSGLTFVEISNSITEIKSGTFAGCSSLTSVEIPNSVTNINTNAFSGCNALKSLSLPSALSMVGWWAFDDCDNIMDIYNPAVTPLATDALKIFVNDVYNNATLWVHQESVSLYQTTYPWSRFKNIKAFDFAGVDELGSDVDAISVVYNLAGQIVLTDASADDLGSLESGIYLIRQGNSIRKVIFP